MASICEWFGGREKGHRCGYCKSESGSVTSGMWGHSYTPREYELLMNRGWRRSGNYFYKPCMQVTCCPQYTIRLKVENFVPSKSQRKVARRFFNFMMHGRGDDKLGRGHHAELAALITMDNVLKFKDDEVDRFWQRVEARKTAAPAPVPKEDSEAAGAPVLSNRDGDGGGDTDADTSVVRGTDEEELAMADGLRAQLDVSQVSPSKKHKASSPPQGQGADPNKPKPRKAKEIRKEKARIKKGMAPDSDQADAGSPAAGPSSAPAPVAAAPAQQPKPKQKQQQSASSSSAPESLSRLLLREFPPQAAHRLEIRHIRAHTRNKAFMATFDEEFLVYKRYQVTIHKDKPSSITRKQFINFLCDSNMHKGEVDPNDVLGAYHTLYYIDDRLAMVGVFDVLPHSTSSVYLFYDPHFSFLSPGTLSTLFEIETTKQYRRHGIDHYYMGYYIHSCSKMRYKAGFVPSQLLCPVTYQYRPFSECKPKLDRSKFARFADGEADEDLERAAIAEWLSSGPGRDAQILQSMRLASLAEHVEAKAAVADVGAIEELNDYIAKVGREAARTLVLYRDEDE